MIEANQLRPAGVLRKLQMSPSIAVNTAGNYIAGYFPHGAKNLNIWFVPTVAVTAAPNVIDIGVASAGETVVKDYSLTHTASAIGTPVDVSSGKILLRVLPLNTVVFVGTSGASTNGTGHFMFEYEDGNN